MSQASSSKLRFFLSSANVTQWELWHNTGLFHGITTNPLILERDGVKCQINSLTSLARSAFELGAQEVHLASWGDNVQKLSSVAFDLAGIDPKRIVVKLPCTLEGVQTATLLRDANIRVSLTGIYSPSQVLIAQAAGAEYAVPCLGRMNDCYGDGQGTATVVQMQQIVSAHDSKMRLLVSSVRDVSNMAYLSSKGCDTFTLIPPTASKMFMVDGTLDAAEELEKAAKRNGAYDCEVSRPNSLPHVGAC